jgi:hypothetical protein
MSYPAAWLLLTRVYLRSSAADLAYGAEGEVRTLKASLEDSHVANYITSASSYLECAGRAQRRRRFGFG